MPREQESSRSRIGFVQALRRKPIELHEAMHVGVSTAVGAVGGAGLGYLNLLDTTLKNGDIEKAAIEGVAATVGGAVLMGGSVLGITANNRGWLRKLEEGEVVEIAPEIMTQDTKSYTKRFVVRVSSIASLLGIPVATMLTGVVITASGHTETGTVVTMAGSGLTALGVTMSGMIELFPRKK